MDVFSLFLRFLALLLSVLSIALIYVAISQCKESAFVPLYYFIALSVGGVLALSIARIEAAFWGNGFLLPSYLLQDLMVSYIALFLFGSLWQSYEAEMCVPSFVTKED